MARPNLANVPRRRVTALPAGSVITDPLAIAAAGPCTRCTCRLTLFNPPELLNGEAYCQACARFVRTFETPVEAA